MMLYQSRDDILRGLRAYVSDFLGGFIHEHTGQEMLAMKIGIEGVLGLNFSPVCFPVIECGQIVARFSCAHQLAIPIATGPSPSGTATPPADSSQGSGQVTLKSTPATELSPACDPIILNRNMAGEFELRIMEDHDHPMFRGHRTVLRFRLVG
ncbi:hypothetical protein BV25DRAFT_1102694 [Artomyces pyxidatus]|uniref:Uncharacterized protein n=1 Tax=Artomyces pyxidatus TaxID=48021 RepID=A0ACB8TG59_9AGAM|nr:hypothetical protein BV25DRAFT_1102694 [Artomyces pyxidatus]